MPDQIPEYTPVSIQPYAEIRMQISSLIDTLSFVENNAHSSNLTINLKKIVFSTLLPYFHLPVLTENWKLHMIFKSGQFLLSLPNRIC